jgi:hypothetical protein
MIKRLEDRAQPQHPQHAGSGDPLGTVPTLRARITGGFEPTYDPCDNPVTRLLYPLDPQELHRHLGLTAHLGVPTPGSPSPTTSTCVPQ